MKINTNNITYNMNRSGRRIGYTKDEVSAVLKPLFESKIPYKEIIAQSGFSHSLISKWAFEIYGMTVNKLLKTFKYENLANKLEDFRKSGKTYYEIGNLFNHSTSWAQTCSKKLGITTEFHSKLDIKLTENVDRMIQEGYTIEKMAKELGCCCNSISKWIAKTYSKNIKEIRKEKNIKITNRFNEQK